MSQSMSQSISQSMLLSRFKDDSSIEIGIDEAGRGSFWGPIMAGAIVIPLELTDIQRTLVEQLRDSKKISPKKRLLLAQQIKELIPLSAVGIVHADEINKNGITWANMEAFRRAVAELRINNVEECRLIIDGTLAIDKWNGEQHVIIEGDNKYMAVAAASILAKVEHDKWIQEYCIMHPECNERYDLVKSKGYGTLTHRNGIKLYGGHLLHRVLYIQNWLPGVSHKIQSKKPKKIDGNRDNRDNECLIKF